jgi:Fic family protein
MSSKTYQPPFTFTTAIVASVSRISELLGAWRERSAAVLTPMLRRGNRIQTIQASLAIEHNTLSVEQVSAVLDGKPVLGPPREIQEVRNAFATYEKLDSWVPDNEEHLLEAHRVLMAGLIDQLGTYRSGGVGVYDGEKLVHMAPPASQVPRLMDELLGWLRMTDLPPLVASCLFHYEFEFIHPFADGNGRMGRLWQTLILTRWKPELAWLPVETVVRDRQQDYYAALANADNEADATPFVAFMLNALEQALVIALQNNEGASDEVSDEVKTKLDDLDRQLLEHIRREPYITQEQLVVLSGKSLSTIQRHIRKLRQYHIERVGSDKTGYWKIK